MPSCAADGWGFARHLLLAGLLSVVLTAAAPGAAAKGPFLSRSQLRKPLVLTQLPAGIGSQREPPDSGGTLRASFGERGRLVVISPDRPARVLSRGLDGACDPEVSFDATRILFAGKRSASDNWNIYETSVDGSNVRRITKDLGDCRSPGYQSTLYTIISPKPWYQFTFVGDGAGTMNESGGAPATDLYSCKLDGSAVRRLTFNLSNDMDPFIMPDGRLLLASWQRRSLEGGIRGRVGIFGINIDGTDYALFAGHRGRRIKHMPCATTGGLVVFVEADEVPWDGAGQLSCVRIRRPQGSYRPITGRRDGLFLAPSPLPGGEVLVSRRPPDGKGTHGVYRLDPSTGKSELLFDDPRYHDVQAKIICPRTEPDGRSSVVTEEDPRGKLYCLNVYLSDLKDRRWLPSGTVRRLRVLEGVPLKNSEAGTHLPKIETLSASRPGSTVNGLPPLAQRRILGEVDVEKDGSFNVEIPANTPVELQTLDADGLALRSCGWIWAKNRESRGCVGCHEDGELTPENVFVEAVQRPSISLCLPPGRRRTVDFRRDVMPIIQQKCVCCHGEGQAPPRLDGRLALIPHAEGKAYFNRAYENLLALEEPREKGIYRGKYVHPGTARTSPLIWHLFGYNTSRGWDGAAAREAIKPIPPEGARPLSDDERRTFVEWIDMGAMWNGISGADHLSGKALHAGGETK